MDKLVREDYHDRLPDAAKFGELTFLLDEGLDLLANFSKIADEETRRALFRLVESMARAEP